jgi:hypothetical protein
MVKFKGRSGHTVRIPSKPISVGFKALALCDAGYTFSWLYTSRLTSIANVVKETELSMTGSAMLRLCESLDSIDYRYTVYMDNAFTTVPLLRMLRDRSIGGCGTTRVNSAELPAPIKSDVRVCWNHLTGSVVKPPTNSDSNTIHRWDSDVLCIRWEDNNIVRFVTTVHP